MSRAADRFACYCSDPKRLETTVHNWLNQHQLLHGVSHLGLAVSGGADSVALFHLLTPLCRTRGIAVTLLHLNHGLRAEAPEEERFVQALAAEAQLPCLCKRVHLADRPADGLSLEMAAREARQTFFRQCMHDANLDAIATGHHADDVAETLLLRLARGAGAAGLSGLRPRSTLNNGLTLIRPLLTVSGRAIRLWLRGRDVTWCEDVSNHDTAIPRNFMRHTLLPQLEKIWEPDLRARLCHSAETLREDDALLDELAEQQLAPLPHNDLPVSTLRNLHPAMQRRTLRLWLFRQSCPPAAAGLTCVQTLLERCREPGDWRISLPGATTVQCKNGNLIFLHDASAPHTIRIPEPAILPAPAPQSVRWGDLIFTTEETRGPAIVPSKIACYPTSCTLSADAIKGRPLLIRARQPGDRIAPTGLTGSKKIQDILVDAKIPAALRDTLPMVVCDNEIAWVPGYRVARRFAVAAPGSASVRITARLAES